VNPKTIWGKEPAVIIGIVAAVALAVVNTLAGQGVLGTDVADTVGKAIDPGQGGWLIPIVVALVTRFAVYSPATVDTIAATAAATGNPEVTLTPP
jgi:hypothetical protein